MIGGEGGVKRFDAQAGEQRVVVDVAVRAITVGLPDNGTEAPRVVIAQTGAIGKAPLHMIMREPKRVSRHSPNRPRHAQVNQKRTSRVKPHQKVLASALARGKRGVGKG